MLYQDFPAIKYYRTIELDKGVTAQDYFDVLMDALANEPAGFQRNFKRNLVAIAAGKQYVFNVMTARGVKLIKLNQ